jgi:hypothetical protein
MNTKIVIPISVIITIVIVVFILTSNQIMEKETSPEITDSPEIQSVLNKIKEDRIKNANSEKPYNPKEREWIESGPFMIDRSEYVLGEKVFVNIQKLDKNTKGEMVFSKIINITHNHEYKRIVFDGSKPQQNFYLGIHLNEIRGFCTIDSLIGEWELIFEGINSEGINFDKTNVDSLKFKIINQIVPGMEKNYEPVC